MIRTTIKLLVLVLTIAATRQVKAQVEGLPNVVGKHYTITSKVLEQDQNITVLLPKDYTSSTDRYPVLYVLDGQWFFTHAAAIQSSLEWSGETPNFVVVGIDISGNFADRYQHFVSQRKRYQEYLANEVISFVESEFRASKEHILFGWQYAGSFALGMLADQPDLFEAYLVATPFPTLGEHDSKVEDMYENIAKNHERNHLYFTTSKGDGSVEFGTDSLASLLSLKSEEWWKYRKLQEESHRSTPYPTLYHGLKAYYYNYQPLEFKSLQEFTEEGGLESVYSYYQQRGQRYHLPTKPLYATMWRLLRLAMDEEDYESFQHFITEFNQFNVLDQSRLSWLRRFASFHYQNQNIVAASKMYQYIVDRFPESAMAHYELGRLYLEQNESEKSLEHLQKAVDIGRLTNDKQMEKYSTALIQLKNKGIK